MNRDQLVALANEVHAHARLRAAQASSRVSTVTIVLDHDAAGAYQLRCDGPLNIGDLVGVLARAQLNVARALTDDYERRDAAELVVNARGGATFVGRGSVWTGAGGGGTGPPGGGAFSGVGGAGPAPPSMGSVVVAASSGGGGSHSGSAAGAGGGAGGEGKV